MIASITKELFSLPVYFVRKGFWLEWFAGGTIRNLFPLKEYFEI